MPARTPIDFTEVMSKRKMTSDRTSQAVPVMRKSHHILPKPGS